MNARTLRLAAGLLAGGLTSALVLAGPSPANASATVPHNPRPPAGIGNGQVIVLRPYRADLVSNRVVIRVVPLGGGPVSLDTLVRVIGDERWATLSSGTVTLKAGLLQRPHTDLRVGPAVHTLELVDSATSPAYLAGSSATITFAGVTVASTAGAAAAPESDHRAWVRYTHGSTVTARRATFQALGSLTSTLHHGVSLGSDSTLTATDTTFRDSGYGLDLYRTAQASLTRVTASGNHGPGIVVNQGRDTALGDLTASGNASGLVLRGPLPGLSVVGTVNANHNSAAGVQAVNLGTAPVGPLHTDHNQTGLLVRQCPGCVLVGLASAADRRGVVISQQSTGAVVRDGSVAQALTTGADLVAPQAVLRHVDVGVADGAIGVRLSASAQGAYVEGGTVTGGRVGVSISAPHSTVTGVAVNGARVGVSVNATEATVIGGTVTNAAIGVSIRAAKVTVTGLSVTDVRVGFRVGGQADGAVLRHISASNTGTGLVTQAGPITVTVSGLHVQQSGGQGVRSNAATFNLDGATVSGATIGLNLNGHATVINSTVANAAEALHAGPHSQVQLTNDVLGAHVLGLRAAQSAIVTLTDCTVTAPLGARGNVRLVGTTRFPALPLSWLGIFALVALTLAIVLELGRKLREHRHDGQVRAPAHVTNTG